ncbi:hypothetical protein MJO28_000721 [Puccinia striiformis f. sp. tritici]|uniref:Uncharacterized protein n=1 Tax=Puccinia striiformis f. sp. tritici TaxID=168172 RepID=A0ACC0EYX4_9BASI|nr:hypothetical protein MJO28_000721 [Puccinia striiformis f. sp. tritici]
MLSRGEFKQGCQAFITRWKSEDSINTPNRYAARGWRWVSVYSAILPDQDLGYMHTDPIDRKLFIISQDDEDIQEGWLEDGDQATLPSPTTANQYQIIKFKASLIYSDTYRVPQFLFQAYKSDGSHLNLTQLTQTDIFYTDFERGIQPDQDLNHPMNLIISSSTSTKGTRITTPKYEKEEEMVRLPILTQTIHPIENVPYWALHPCNTHFALTDILSPSLLPSSDLDPNQRSKFRLIIECFFSIVYSLIRT